MFISLMHQINLLWLIPFYKHFTKDYNELLTKIYFDTNKFYLVDLNSTNRRG